MKIIFITTLYPDSKEQSLIKVPYALHYFVQNWVKEKHEVEVIKIEATYPKYLPQYFKTNKTRTERDTLVDNVNVHIIQVKKNLNRHFAKSSAKRASIQVFEYLKKKHIDYDVVIFHVYEPSFYIADELKSRFNIPIIWGFHQSDINWIKTNKNFESLCKNLNNISAIAFRSNALKTSFEQHFEEKNKSFIISSGIPKDIIKTPVIKRNVRNLRFITVANMIQRKNLDILIKAFSALSKDNKEITLKILGSGKEMNRLKDLAVQLKAEDSITFLGYCDREKVFEELGQSDVFVLPSVNETFGMVYLEAMSQGCIPIGTSGEGIDGIIENGKNGYLCDPNINSCYNNMKIAMNLNQDEIENIKDEIRKTVSIYTEEKCSKYYIDRIQEVVKLYKS